VTEEDIQKLSEESIALDVQILAMDQNKKVATKEMQKAIAAMKVRRKKIMKELWAKESLRRELWGVAH